MRAGIKSLLQLGYCRALLSGALIPFGFAPFHIPGLTFIGLGLFFSLLTSSLINTRKHAFFLGFTFGLAFLGIGVSWVYVSIHEYGHLNWAISSLITLLFIAFIALYMGLFSLTFFILRKHASLLWNCMLFSALWCLTEYLRSSLFTGFPWLLLGFGQIDTPLKFLLPIIGVYGVSFMTCLAASMLALSCLQSSYRNAIPWLFAGITLIVTPSLLSHISWTTEHGNSFSVGIIQANLSMKDKWDETLFWDLVHYYKKESEKLLKHTQIIVMPEAAIPAPESYVTDLLEHLHQTAQKNHSSILLGIPTESSENRYYNSLLGLGLSSGIYQKRHLVPFGEFIPKPFKQIMNWLSIPLEDVTPGPHHQSLIQVNEHPIAALICYELAYPSLLREQLPEAEWIVSISDDGWFGHSFAMYQQLQMAAALSLQTGRYQIMANNVGLSSIINPAGEIVASLPAFQAGILKSQIYTSSGTTPWVHWGDSPILLLSIILVMAAILLRQERTRQIEIIAEENVS